MVYANGMQTRVWGPAAWLFLHCIAHNYDPSRAKVYRRFFTNLREVLPCGTCRDNYGALISGTRGAAYALTEEVLKSRESFAFWWFRIHARVSADLYATCARRGEPCTRPMPETRRAYRTVRARYESYRAASCTPEEGGCRRARIGRRKRTLVRVVANVDRKRSAETGGGKT